MVRLFHMSTSIVPSDAFLILYVVTAFPHNVNTTNICVSFQKQLTINSRTNDVLLDGTNTKSKPLIRRFYAFSNITKGLIRSMSVTENSTTVESNILSRADDDTFNGQLRKQHS